MKNRLFKEIDNAPLILFRIFFGFLLACETFGAIGTGWVKANFIEPQFTFSHIGMDWLQPLPGNGMYYYFAIMGTLGLLVMLGYKYRFTLGLYTIMWAGVYFMQKTSYNNHYYLLLLVCLIMFFLPANRYAAIDAKQNPALKKLTMPAWCSGVMILQVAIVYFYATVAKFYPGWLDGTFTKNLLAMHSGEGFFHEIATQKWFYMFIAYAGIIFDLFIVPLLLYKRTRTIALIASVIFHIFNSITLQIGIFPFFALSFVVFFYPPERIRQVFFKKKPAVTHYNITAEKRNILLYFFIPYFIIQLLLPIRHYFIKGDVLWTEEGHRLSWRMMLRSRNGYTTFRVINKANNEPLPYRPLDYMTRKQLGSMQTKPDMIWQNAQRIKKHFKDEGLDVAVYVISKAGINGAPLKTLIDEGTDLAATEWNYFFHNDWILLYDSEGNLVK
ncbi:HTTM domain-containing protein [Flavobacterium salilacus subsp. salilacus]|uniref:HTTM domain-containing protein n=1 Tax=Flavobacterium TaxID=237 RepID=UPI0010754DE4|nr:MULTISPECIES: HTTM domain-containing protein [Flavobacterium]KAF2520207.1 HTTM domain-containing protein [Flavobacterium salilacus subsp. salilacus]MBE1613875.1 HTTM domain-containing protein [Flavobacterium sp. SaA2.13]